MNCRNLPEALKESIERARVKAERQFREAEKRLPPHPPHIPGKPCPWFVKSAEARRLLINRIKTEVLADAREVCVFARGGQVKASDIRAIIDRILETRCIELCPDPYSNWGDRSYKFQGEVSESLFGSSEWEEHLTERLEATERDQAGDRHTTPSEPKEVAGAVKARGEGQNQATQTDKAPLTWEDIEIQFLSDHRVEEVRGVRKQVLTYAEMGFQHRRTSPKKAGALSRHSTLESGSK